MKAISSQPHPFQGVLVVRLLPKDDPQIMHFMGNLHLSFLFSSQSVFFHPFQKGGTQGFIPILRWLTLEFLNVMEVIRLDQLNREQFQEDEGKVVKSDAGAIELPSMELTYPPKKKVAGKMSFLFPQVGYVSSLEDNHIDRIGLAYFALCLFLLMVFFTDSTGFITIFHQHLGNMVVFCSCQPPPTTKSRYIAPQGSPCRSCKQLAPKTNQV